MLNPDIVEVLNDDPLVADFLSAIYESRYGDFFRLLLEINCHVLEND